MFIAICIQSPFANGESPYAICLDPIPACIRGVSVCKRGLPICIRGCHFWPALINKWITHHRERPSYLFLHSHLHVSWHVWGKECLFLLQKTFSANSFGAISERIESGGRRRQLEAANLDFTLELDQTPHKKQTYPRRTHMGIAICIQGSPWYHRMHMGIVQSLTICIWLLYAYGDLGQGIPICK